jgi:hypothetical protein
VLRLIFLGCAVATAAACGDDGCSKVCKQLLYCGRIDTEFVDECIDDCRDVAELKSCGKCYDGLEECIDLSTCQICSHRHAEFLTCFEVTGPGLFYSPDC